MLQARTFTSLLRLALPSHPCQVLNPPKLHLRDEGKRQARLLELSGRGKSTDVRPLEL